MKYKSRGLLGISLLSTSLLAACVGMGNSGFSSHKYPTLNGAKPLVIAHRGASGYLPEHTLAAYKRAIELGADFVEPDLVVTKDGHLVARHEPNITSTTDVVQRPEFASRKKTVMMDGVAETGWFTEDFTLAEIKTLRAKQTIAERDPAFDGQFEVPTMREILELVNAENANASFIASGRIIGVYPETKHPTHHDSIGLSIEPRLLALLNEYGLNKKDSAVVIQSFEVSNLKLLRQRTPVRLVQLIGGGRADASGKVVLTPPNDRPYDFRVTKDARTVADLMTPAGLREIKTYADGIGPAKHFIVSSAQTLGADGKPKDLNGDGKFDDRDRTALPPSSLVKDAHAAGLFVHPYTFRNDARFLLSDYAGDPKAEYIRFYNLGVDGVFSDFSDTAVAARQ